MEYRWCNEREQRVCADVCDARISAGRCLKSSTGCAYVNEPQELSDEERQKRRERMQKINERKVAAQVDDDKWVQGAEVNPNMSKRG